MRTSTLFVILAATAHAHSALSAYGSAAAGDDGCAFAPSPTTVQRHDTDADAFVDRNPRCGTRKYAVLGPCANTGVIGSRYVALSFDENCADVLGNRTAYSVTRRVHAGGVGLFDAWYAGAFDSPSECFHRLELPAGQCDD
uniref:Secreted protein n=1 Tax=Achlya hypogyna TaxID=1202772 RepID=A0A0A7CNS4_ACHHY|nr:secreted protein [Achlya hypogyna]